MEHERKFLFSFHFVMKISKEIRLNCEGIAFWSAKIVSENWVDEVAQKAARVMQSILVYHRENCCRHNASQFDYVSMLQPSELG